MTPAAITGLPAELDLSVAGAGDVLAAHNAPSPAARASLAIAEHNIDVVSS